MQASSLQLYKQKDSDTIVFQWILWNCQEQFFYKTPPDDYFCVTHFAPMFPFTLHKKMKFSMKDFFNKWKLIFCAILVQCFPVFSCHHTVDIKEGLVMKWVKLVFFIIRCEDKWPKDRIFMSYQVKQYWKTFFHQPIQGSFSNYRFWNSFNIGSKIWRRSLIC